VKTLTRTVASMCHFPAGHAPGAVSATSFSTFGSSNIVRVV
jgi:hypothetical protein